MSKLQSFVDSGEAKKWVWNMVVFLAPTLAIFFAQLALGVQFKEAFLVALLGFYGTLADLFKKLKSV